MKNFKKGLSNEGYAPHTQSTENFTKVLSKTFKKGLSNEGYAPHTQSTENFTKVLTIMNRGGV